MTRRIKLTIEYNGLAFAGWQRQPNVESVQGLLEDALFKITGEKVETAAAGRTDKGVHAVGQVVHFDVESNAPLIKFKDGLTHYMRPHVAVVRVEEVPGDFHARFSATMRHYRLSIFNRRMDSPIWRDRTLQIREPLDEKAMHEAAQFLLGEQDFSSFRASECQSSTPMCFMESISVVREGDLVHIDLSGNHFLHNMVRIITGTLAEIGRGTHPPAHMKQVLEAKDRTKAGATVPPQGLYFKGVTYPPHSVKETC